MNVDLLHNIYGKSLFDNEKNIIFWENYLRNLETLDFNLFSEKLTVPVLVPIGSRILFRGELQHTNEVIVALGADYFTKCSVKQAEILKQHRIKVAKSKLELLKKEKDYLQNQLSFSKQTILDQASCDIVEVVSDEEDKKWRKLHQEKVRLYKQTKAQDDEEPKNQMSNEELWNRLEELELQEELENELTIDKSEKSIPEKQHLLFSTAKADDNKDRDDDEDINDTHIEMPSKCFEVDDPDMENCSIRNSFFQQPSKLHLFELVVERHNAVKELITKIRSKQKQSKTEEDLIEKVNDMEILEKLEDELAILEDMLASDNEDDIEDAEREEEYTDIQQKKTVAFADEDESETFEITFKHSDVEPCREPYDHQKGITKPSDIHKAFSSYFNSETVSILKKTKYGVSPGPSKTVSILQEKKENDQDQVNQDSINSTIVVKDVVEKVNCVDNNINQNERPMSLFKKRRQQLKE